MSEVEHTQLYEPLDLHAVSLVSSPNLIQAAIEIINYMHWVGEGKCW